MRLATGFLHWRGHAFLALPARLYLGVVFLLACYHKIVDPASFAVDVATYQLLPLPLLNLSALILPWIELLAGAMLVLGFRTRAAAVLVAGMMLLFMGALGWALHLGLDMSCGCFASSGTEDPISGLTMLRDGGWLALALYVLVFDRHPIGIDRLWPRRTAESTS
jgi:uncharacterized membrane protein YphA (DoxX/SURF4 family)